MNLNINDDIINLNVSENSTKIESSNNNIELNISNNNMNVEGETKELNLGILPPKVVVSEKDHNKLLNRDLPNQHPIKSIEGLEENGDGTKFLSDDGTYKEVKIFDDVVEDILVNGASVVDENNNANIFVPTNTSELLNDSGFITNLAKDLVNYYLKSEVYNKEEINQLASTLQNVSITIVTSLPSTGETNVIYFVSKTGKENDVYDEWIYINSKWEHIGSTQVDLTGYATEKWVKDQDYMPIPDFREYMKYFHYTKDETDAKLENYYDKEEVDAKLEELPTGGTELTGGDNTVIEENKINVYTNTGYK
ncbi:MAG: hypothetical protein J6C46_08655, partial [Clostridia bacterium]|nr:hypothetical protein [Clostridia bacterium]